ncbi:MAG: trimethylamine methyltransferase family protein [Arenicellales bacterium]
MARRKNSKRKASLEKRKASLEIEQTPGKPVINRLTPVSILSQDEVESLHQASLKVLAEHGIQFSLSEARAILKTAGAEVQDSDGMVRFDPDMLMDYLAKAPAAFTLHARNPAHDLRLGDRHVNFSSVSSAPHCTDTLKGRRTGNREDFENFLRLTQTVNVAHGSAGYPVEPIDIPVPVRHLYATRAILALTDKTFRLYNHNRQRTLDVLEMTRIAHNLSAEAFIEKPCVFASINPNSPREYDESMLWGMIECARAGQVLMISPFILAGAMAPVSVAGALVQQNAEALAGIAFCQMVRAGTPVTYGGFVSNADMKSGAPAFGTPEHVKTTLVIGQMARRYNLPYRSANANASNAVDAQAAYESQMCLWACLMSGATYVYHGLGWLEGGLSASFEKFIVDAEMIQGLTEVLKPIDLSAKELAVDVIGQIPPGGHFFGSNHTIERYEHAFYHPMLSDWRNFETWNEAGALDATQRAAGIVKTLLHQYQPPAMDQDVALALDDFVARRESQGGAPVQ